MVNPINNASPNFVALTNANRAQRSGAPTAATTPGDRVDFGSTAVSQSQALQVVSDRAFEQLRSVVSEARAELGLPEGASIDTSPEATANRIADFALGFFSQYAENNGLDDTEEGRAKFASFIGGAIEQGISEAREILGALQALSPDVESGIDQTATIIQERLDDFVANGL